ncbi:MAG: SGNH/GDSL hydrolase family protein, partial [Actinobacteria bacterium]|nr:SGNH/GDSL hydrolase family protein [Actinomycetota bacterium]
MSRAGRAKRIATAAAYGGGGLGVAGALGAGALYGLIKGEARLARRRIPVAGDTDFPDVNDSSWAADGVSTRRPPIRLAVLGDSLAAGYGVHRDRDTPAVRIAIGISAAARRPVHVTNVAAVGAESTMLDRQFARLSGPLDLAVVIVGANDVTHRVKPAVAVRALSDTVLRLRGRGAEVVVATCPDLGTIRPIAQPLRYFARRLSRGLAAAQTIAVVEAGGRTVSLGDLLGPLFAERLDLFSEDHFHPSAAGYAAAAN